MWWSPLNFVTLHYVYILFMGFMGIVVLYPAGNISAIDSYFFGVSSSTESGLNTVDLKLLKTYQQLFMYFVPVLTNVGFVNIIVVVVRLWWFRKYLQKTGPNILRGSRQRIRNRDIEFGPGTGSPWPGTPVSSRPASVNQENMGRIIDPRQSEEAQEESQEGSCCTETKEIIETETKAVIETEYSLRATASKVEDHEVEDLPLEPRITFDPSIDHHPRRDGALYIPGPRDRDRGQPLVELGDGRMSQEEFPRSSSSHMTLRRRNTSGSRLSEARSLERVTSVARSMFVIGNTERKEPRLSMTSHPTLAMEGFPQLSREVTIGRNSVFRNLSSEDRQQLGGIEYRTLKLLLKIVVSYFFGLHLLAFILLVGWIQYAPAKYTDYIAECGQGKTWWAFYSAQTMTTNLGFTLTPDSMLSFRDAPVPMLMMSFIALAGYTCYPIFLRLLIWTMSKIAPKHSSIQEPLSFLLNHPRRCYTLLFPSGPTWALFGIIVLLNVIDTVLIIVLDLDNPAVSDLPGGQRLAAAIFQSVSSRHTGTSSFNLAEVNPAVQLSLVVMMYISAYPIAIAIRSSNTYEERSLGLYQPSLLYDEQDGTSYLITHMRNQLSFDMWYIFFGIFAICIAESSRIMNDNDPAFTVWPIIFEVVSAYGNVGLSLGYPTVATSLSSQFSTFSKLVMCAMMLRGRHRGLPYKLDRAIVLPDERTMFDDDTASERPRSRRSAFSHFQVGGI